LPVLIKISVSRNRFVRQASGKPFDCSAVLVLPRADLGEKSD
jgi:hypothetical protein